MLQLNFTSDQQSLNNSCINQMKGLFDMQSNLYSRNDMRYMNNASPKANSRLYSRLLPENRSLNFRKRIISDLNTRRKGEADDSPSAMRSLKTQLKDQCRPKLSIQAQRRYSNETSQVRRSTKSTVRSGVSQQLRLFKKSRHPQLADLLQDSKMAAKFKRQSLEKPDAEGLSLLTDYYVQMKNLGEALRTISRLLLNEPRNPQALHSRAKIYLLLNRKQQAKKDYQILCQVSKCEIYLLELFELEQTPQMAFQLIQKYNPNDKVIKHVVKKLMDLGHSKQVMEMTGDRPQNSFFSYMKSEALKQMGNRTGRMLALQDCLKYDNDRHSVTKALIDLITTKIQHREYYQGLHLAQRAGHLHCQMFSIQPLKVVLQGMVSMMKRKYEQGIRLFSMVKLTSLGQIIKQSATQCLAYGYFCIGSHIQAKSTYLLLGQIDNVSRYNLSIVEGLLASRCDDHKAAQKFFEEAKVVIEGKVQPYVYKALSYIKESRASGKQIDNFTQLAFAELNQGAKLNPNSSFLLSVRSLLNFQLGFFKEGFQDINQAIQKSDQNSPHYYFYRGCAYSFARNYKQANSEFSICLNLDKNYHKAFLERAKCLFLQGETDRAFGDLQRCLQIMPEDYSVHKWIGNLLLASGCYADAYKAYSQVKQTKQANQIKLDKAKALIKVGQFYKAYRELQSIEGFDKSILKVLTKCTQDGYEPTWLQLQEQIIKQRQGKIFSQLQLHQVTAITWFHMEQYQKAVSQFQKAKMYLFGQAFAIQIRGASSDLTLATPELIDRNIAICEYMLGKKQGQVKAGPLGLGKKFLTKNKRKIKLGFGVGRFRYPDIYPNYIKNLIGEMAPQRSENKPEAPWIKRGKGGVVFTGNIMQLSQSLWSKNQQLSQDKASASYFDNNQL